MSLFHHHHRLSHKRKLDDLSPSPLPDLTIKMPKPTSSSSSLQFFIRLDSRSLTVRASPTDTLTSLLTNLHLSPTHHRFIHCGRQLNPDHTLSQLSIHPNSTLLLTSRLRSTSLPLSHQLISDLLSSLHSHLHSTPIPNHIATLDSLIKTFLRVTPTASDGDPDDKTTEHLSIFLESNAPSALVALYKISPTNRTVAERAIKLFLDPSFEYFPRRIQKQCYKIVLQFCKLIGENVGRSDNLYVSCRNCLAEMLRDNDGAVWDLTASGVVEGLVSFVTELADVVVRGLENDTLFMSANDLADFGSFLLAVKRAVVGNGGKIGMGVLNEKTHPVYDYWIWSLHRVFLDVLKGVDGSLERIERVLKEKGEMHSEARWGVWAHVLTVLTDCKVFAKVYEGAAEMIHGVLVERRVSVNALLRRAKRNEKLCWFLKVKDVVDFEAKRNLTLMLFAEGKDDYDQLHEMLIDRSQILAESFEYIGQAEAHWLRGGLFMEFKNEEATGPGVLREWFCLVCRAIFNPQNVLFLSCPNDRQRFYPNPASAVDPMHLKYFGFCGRVIALALMHKVQVGVVFDRVFFLQLADKPITLEDVKVADPCLYMSCKKILEMDAELLDSDVLGLTFVRDIEELGAQSEVELCPGGKDIVVNSMNRHEYIKLLIQHRFVTSISPQVHHFSQGFGDILSNSKFKKLFFSSLDLEDFDRMLGGSNSIINITDWKAHTEYNGYNAKDSQIVWFWKVIEGMLEEQRRVLLFFWTSVKYLPVDGFGGLSSKLYIYKAADSHDHLPTSHTCFYRLCLPRYPSLKVMRERLQLITQEHVSCTFGMW